MPDEAEELHTYGITRLYSPDDGRAMGLQGMINDLLSQTDYATGKLDADRWREAIDQAYGRMAPVADNGRTAVAISPRVPMNDFIGPRTRCTPPVLIVNIPPLTP